MPACGQGASLRFSIADDAGYQQIRIIERGAKSVGQCIAQLPAFMNRAGCFGRDMAGNPARKRELFEELLHSRFVLRNVWIDLAVSAFEVGIGDKTGPAMPRTRDIDHAQIVVLDGAVEMNIDEVQPRRGAPMAEKARLDVLAPERF